MSRIFFWVSHPNEAYSFPVYDNEQTWASIDVSAMYRPGITLLSCCGNSIIGTMIWFTIFLRVGMFIASTVIYSFDFDGAMYLNPEQLVYFINLGYIVPTTLYAVIRYNPSADSSSHKIPIILKFSWFCFDIGLPASFACLIMYCTNVVVNKRQQMTIGLFVCNFVQMFVCEASFGRMILLPNRFLLFMVVWVVAGIGYTIHFKGGFNDFVFGVLIGIFSFYITSWFTYFRVNLFRDNKPVISLKSGVVLDNPVENLT
jgi:hypothetical protein